MLLSDYCAMPHLIQAFRQAERNVQTTTGKVKRKHAFDMRGLVSDCLSQYLQETLCRANPGKAMPFVSPLTVMNFCKEMEQYPDKHADIDFCLVILKQVIEREK